MSGQVIPVEHGRIRFVGTEAQQSEQRKLVVDEALSWIGTPFHERAAVKGEKGGVDCARFIAAVFKGALSLEMPVPDVSLQYNLHHSDELYLREVEKYFHEIGPTPLPGDLVIPKLGRIHWHGSIVIEWPYVVSAHGHAGKVLKTNAEVDDWIVGRELKFYSLW